MAGNENYEGDDYTMQRVFEAPRLCVVACRVWVCEGARIGLFDLLGVSGCGI